MPFKFLSWCRAAGCLAVAGLVACGAIPAPAGGPVEIEITHQWGDAALQLGAAAPTQQTAAGESFTVDKLRYYLSNVRLRRDDGEWFAPPADPDSSAGYQLIDAAIPASQKFEIAAVPAGRYTGLEFLLGVDATRNHAGAQTGALDPTRGLFWSWKTGYIFFLFEGHSPQAGSSGHTLAYHVGGDDSATRKVFLPLAPKPARVEPRLVPVIHLKADVTRLFDSPHVIRFAEHPSAMDAAGTAPVADNAAAMFSVDHLHHEPLAVR